ncbi:hypothetical protein SAMN00017405_1295 [Desulfonispora thiosulfatigenes DSM 11270]|uniref:Uncharacterized protein n=1 Tax=Desulfonispora thiosulfatigenes DSM 11270 TaxID=656914 RepID=A0A1W1VAC0_DESTI|nr:hypothetical protein [Desulfonispora thiosulfatigenes]SMB90302.1 hypothetical protein SAMN00017405_1295 [Desulfonispora thiosulfatigenes DSM 11270]
MWPLVEVHSTGAAWGYFAILWSIIILGPMLLGFIINKVWWKPHFEKKMKQIDEEIQNMNA